VTGANIFELIPRIHSPQPGGSSPSEIPPKTLRRRKLKFWTKLKRGKLKPIRTNRQKHFLNVHNLDLQRSSTKYKKIPRISNNPFLNSMGLPNFRWNQLYVLQRLHTTTSSIELTAIVACMVSAWKQRDQAIFSPSPRPQDLILVYRDILPAKKNPPSTVRVQQSLV